MVMRWSAKPVFAGSIPALAFLLSYCRHNKVLCIVLGSISDHFYSIIHESILLFNFIIFTT